MPAMNCGNCSAAGRLLAELTFKEASEKVSQTSILCLPLGAIEQHGPHLPLNTDVIIAEGMTQRIVARWGADFDLWQLPSLALGLSREHDWAPGSLSLSIAGFTALMRDLAKTLTYSLPARNLVFVNGHGGNRGMLEVLLHELAGDFDLNCCVIHPFDLAIDGAGEGDVHGGRVETSVMMVLAPHLVRSELIGKGGSSQEAAPEAVRSLIFDRGVSWPWRTDDPRLAREGVIGDASAASAANGEAIIGRLVEAAEGVLRRLLEHQNSMPPRDPRSR